MNVIKIAASAIVVFLVFSLGQRVTVTANNIPLDNNLKSIFSKYTSNKQVKTLIVTSRLTEENLLAHSQQTFDRSLNILQSVIGAMGVATAVLGFIFAVLAGLGFTEIKAFKQLKKDLENDVKLAKENAITAKEALEEVKAAANSVQPIVDSLARLKSEVEKEASSLKDILLTKSDTDNIKFALDSYGNKLAILEALGFSANSDELIAKGNNLFTKGNYDLAILVYEKILEKEPDNVLAKGNIAACKSRQGKHHEALDIIQPIIASGKAQQYHYNTLCTALINIGHFDDAINIAINAIEENKTNNKMYNLLADSFVHSKKFTEAIKYYELYLEKEKIPDKDFFYNMACAYAATDNNELALTYLKNAFEHKPELKEHALTDEDLSSICHLQEFKELINIKA